MSKVTSKLQVTIPKAIATRLGIRPGDEIQWHEQGDGLRIELIRKSKLAKGSADDCLKWFEQATQRQEAREATAGTRIAGGSDRGWTGEGLYERGSAD